MADYDGVLADLKAKRAALDRERKLVAKMGTIEFHDKAVILTAPAPIQ